jgi:ABC-type transport system involved in multi-copper enzyme maturation permease subunit
VAARALNRLDANNQRFVPVAAGRELAGAAAAHKRRARVPSKPARRVGNFPIFWRATRPLQLTMSFGLALALLTLGSMYMAGVTGGFFDVDVLAGVLTGLLALLGGVLGLLASATVSSERQHRTWQVLLCAPMTRRRIAAEKLLGVLWRVRWLYLLIVVQLFAACCLGVVRIPVMLNLLLILVWVTVYALGSGLFLSTHCKTTLVACLICIGQLAFLWGLLPTLAAPLGRTICPDDPAAFERQAGVFFTASPLNAIHDSIETLPDPRNAEYSAHVNSYRVPADTGNDLLHWFTITARQAVQGAGYCVLGIVLAAVSIMGFRRAPDR